MIYDNQVVGSIYRASPNVVQDMLVSVYGLLTVRERLSRSYRKLRRLLDRTQWMSAAEIQALQLERLGELLVHSYENVPFYRRRFDALRLKPRDIRSIDDLAKIPELTKDDLRNNWRDLLARNVSRRSYTIGRTGGTTGIPLEFALDHSRVSFDHALIERHWSWAGHQFRDAVAIIRGLTLVPTEATGGRLWRRDYVTNRYYLSGFHLSPKLMPKHIQLLESRQPPFIAGYPSSLYTLARHLELTRQRLQVKAVFTSSELLTPTERALIEDRFQTKVWDRYGTGERCVVGQQCEYGEYHQNAEYGLLEITDTAGGPAPAGRAGNLIQTSLTNFAMPLIRYVIGDTGSVSAQTCACGRGLPLMGDIGGRKDDVIVTADGRLMPQAGLDQIYELVPRLERCQLVQDRVGYVDIRVLPRPGFNDADRSELITQLQRRTGPGTQISVTIVDRLELTGQGKGRFILSRLTEDIKRGVGTSPPSA